MFKNFLLRYTLWITSTVIITLFVGCFYFVTAQALRQLANEPQIQIAYDAAAALNAHDDPAKAVPSEQKDIATSRGPFMVVYKNNLPMAGNGLLDGKLPSLPKGVLDYARAHGDDRITWQPRANSRMAIVVVPYGISENQGYVMVGRSLAETERLKSQVLYMVLCVWVVGTLATLIVNLFILRSKKPAPTQNVQK